jgi:molecular chaperone DnaK
VTIHVLQGEREMSAGNKSLGQFNLTDIPAGAARHAADRGHLRHRRQRHPARLGAKDKGTGKENKITIKANSGLSEAEIQAMVQDAAAHAEDDRKAHELVDARNQCDAMVHSIKKALAEHGDKIGADEKSARSKPPSRMPKKLKDGDKAAIEAKTEALAKASQKLGEKVYAEAQGAAARPAVPARRLAAHPAARRRRTTATWSMPSSPRSRTRRVKH